MYKVGDTERFNFIVNSSGSTSRTPAPEEGFFLVFNPFTGREEKRFWGSDPRVIGREELRREKDRKDLIRVSILWKAYYDRQSRAESAIKRGKAKAGLLKTPVYPGRPTERNSVLLIDGDYNTYSGLYVDYVGRSSKLRGRPFWLAKSFQFFKDKFSSIEDINTSEVFKVPSKDLQIVGLTEVLNKEV